MKLSPLTFASREEIDVTLNVTAGQVPSDMYGHAFFNSMCGTVNSPPPIPPTFPDGSRNSEYGEMIFNGDGMVFRFDLDEAGVVKVKSKMMKPPCYYADEATKFGTSYFDNGLHFKGMGMARNSMKFGSRNQLNTSLNAFKLNDDEKTRISVNFDAGRPFEIDPPSMELKTPIGSNEEWKIEFPLVMESVFPLVQTTAHPSFDPVTREFFTVNFVKSADNLIAQAKIDMRILAKDEHLVSQHIRTLYDKIEGKSLDTSSLFSLLGSVFNFLAKLISGKRDIRFDVDKIIGDIAKNNEQLFGMHNAVWLMKWDGRNSMKRWRVVDEGGKDIAIFQTMHQTNYSKDYIVLVDSSLKFAFDMLFSDPFPKEKWLDELIRWITTKTLLPETPIYIIKRSDLQINVDTVTAKRIIVGLETVHYSIDYDNPDDMITIHTAHNTASCAAEWIRPYDKLAVNKNQEVYPNTIGLMTCGEMDIGRIGKFVINGNTGKIVSQDIIHEKGFTDDVIKDVKAHTWAVALNTYRDMISADVPVRKIRKNYWQSYGLDKRMLTHFIWSLYHKYQNRIIPADKLLEYTKTGVPFCLFRQDTDTMKIDEDYWVFKMNENFRSLQFIPRSRPNGIPANVDPDMDGYIFCTMVNGSQDIDNDNNAYSREIWIFDAANLAQGPICKMEHPDLQFAFTIHSLWVPDCVSSDSSYKVSIKEDYDWVINQFFDPVKKSEMKDFMKKNVYPHFVN